ncbi:hypothetical protein DIPPA_32516, partial [Diplonema papillatum]
VWVAGVGLHTCGKMAFRNTKTRLMAYGHLAGKVSMMTTVNRRPAYCSHDYVNRSQINNRALYGVMKRERPWWKEMPKFIKPNLALHWFEPLPAQNYLTWKADGLYVVPNNAIITLQHVLHLKMLPVKMIGRTFTMPLVRWLVGARMKSVTGVGLVRNEPVFKLTKPKYWAKS